MSVGHMDAGLKSAILFPLRSCG
uniref:Uncharacterized protein n=1 Tax=Lepeophtheirus salmonis TaxID=72036 RepID=A0A0K2V1Z7_LEPSM